VGPASLPVAAEPDGPNGDEQKVQPQGVAQMRSRGSRAREHVASPMGVALPAGGARGRIERREPSYA
jgi:hypothetical protein